MATNYLKYGSKEASISYLNLSANFCTLHIDLKVRVYCGNVQHIIVVLELNVLLKFQEDSLQIHVDA